MSRIQIDSKTKGLTGVHTTPKSTPEQQTPAALFECLIASSNISRAASLEEAALEQGWQPIVCHDVEEALRTAVCRRIGLAVVDLDPSGTADTCGYREVVEQVAAARGPLVLVCGTDGDASEEIWARQLGAWMYLPGIDGSTDLTMLFGEAKNIAEKLNPNSSEGAPTHERQSTIKPR